MRNSKIILCEDILIDREYKNVLAYTKQQMQDLINSKKVKESNTYSFIRETGKIIVGFKYNEILNVIYMAYQNPDYENKWFYAFVDKVQYKSENSCEITFTIDAFSTWYTDTTKKQCFVIREHVSDDTIGKHTIPENLMTGDYKEARLQEIDFLKQCKIILASTTSPKDKTQEVSGIYQGIPTGVGYYAYAINSTDIAILKSDLQYLTDEGKKSSIVGLFIVPNALTNNTDSGNLITNSYSADSYTTTIDTPSAIDSYVPKNNKCWCYPYCYTLISNGAGGSIILKPELWTNNSQRQITIKSAISVGASVVLYPKSYAGSIDNFEMSLPLGKYPTLNYSTDLYTNWCTENALNVSYAVLNGAENIVMGGLNTASAIQSGNSQGALGGMSQISGGVESIGNALYSQMLADRVPPQFAGNLNCGDVNFSDSKITYRITERFCRREYIECIDDYFTRFGYKVNKLKLPAILSRTYWNYVQIGDGETYVHSGAPTEYLDIINNIFRHGTTLWHDHANIGNYSLNNTIRNN